MHVDDSLTTTWPVNRGVPHHGVMVEDAGYNPVMDATMNPEGRVTDSAQWWYPNETRRAALFSDDVPGQEMFSPTTTPNSDGYRFATGVEVRVDSINGSRLYATVRNPLAIDSDADGIPDIRDNCIDIPNFDQLDTDSNGVGDACQFCCIGVTGNVDDDPTGTIDIGDLTALIAFLFIPPNTPPACIEEANIDGDLGGIIDIGDLTALIGYLFIPPNVPPADCQ